MKEDLEYPDNARIVDFDSRIADRADGDGQSDPLQEREVDVDIEPLRLETGETAGDGLEGLPNGRQMIQSFAQTEIGEIVGAQFVAQESGELLILPQHGALEVGAEDMMAMLDLIDDGGELAAVPAVDAGAEDRNDLVGSEPPQTEFAAALEQIVNRKVALEDNVAAILDLADGIEA